MKKAVALLLVFASLVFMLSACGKYSEEEYQAAFKAGYSKGHFDALAEPTSTPARPKSDYDPDAADTEFAHTYVYAILGALHAGYVMRDTGLILTPEADEWSEMMLSYRNDDIPMYDNLDQAIFNAVVEHSIIPTQTPQPFPSPTPAPTQAPSSHQLPQSYDDYEHDLEMAYEAGWDACMREYGIEP